MPSARGVAATIEMAREKDGSLWVYLIEGVKRSALREITWFADGDAGEECWVGVYVAKPGGEGELDVTFSHLVVEVDSG